MAQTDINLAAKPDKSRVASDDSDLAAWLVALWRTRYLMALTALLTLLALLGLLAFTRAAIPATQTFRSAVQFVFPGYEKAKYPNGSPFSINDLLAPSILQQVYQQNRIDSFGIDQKTFISAFSVSPFAVGYNEAVLRYRERLSDRKLSFTERKEIEDAMKLDLSTMGSRGAMLEFTIATRIPLPPQIAEKVLSDTMREWARYNIEQRGVIKMPAAATEQQRLDVAKLDTTEPLIVAELINDGIVRLDRQLQTMIDLSGEIAIIDEKTGHTPTSLIRASQLTRQYELVDMYAQILSAKDFNDRDGLVAFLKLRLTEAERNLRDANQRAQSASEAFNLYTNKSGQNELQQSNAPSAIGPANANANANTNPQLGEGFIDRLIDLIKQQTGKDTEYRQNLVTRFVDAKATAAEAASRGQRTKEFVDTIGATAGGETQSSRVPQIKEKLRQLVVLFNDYTDIATRLFDKVSTTQMTREGRLYMELLLRDSEKRQSYHPYLNRTVYLLSGLVAVAAAILAMFISLARQMLRKRQVLD